MSDSLRATTIRITGDGGDEIEAYLARPDGDGPRGGVVVIHHMPGYDRATKEIVRRFAELGYDAICPNLYWREAPGAAPGRRRRDACGPRAACPDERLVGDVGGRGGVPARAADVATARSACIGYCSGGRQTVLAACHLDVDAAVDCYGAFVTGTPPAGCPLKVTNLVDQLPNLRCPLLGLFGNEDKTPSPEHVDELDADPHRARQAARVPPLRRRRATRSSPSTGPSYRVAAANDGWERIADLLRHPPRRGGLSHVHLRHRDRPRVDGSAKGPGGKWFHVTDATVYFDHPVHAMAEHTLNIDLADPSRGPGPRVAVELTRESAARLVAAIQTALASAPEGV